MQKSTNDIILLLIATAFLIMLLAVFILYILYLHRKKQLNYLKTLKVIEETYEKNLLQTQLEIQEQTCQYISREIHDNITLSLTLAKLHLNTIEQHCSNEGQEKITCAIELLSKSILELSDISKSLNADVIIQHGLLKAIEEEIQRIRSAGLFEVDFEVDGLPIYMTNQRELFVFRILQEAFNNIIKHSKATRSRLELHFSEGNLKVEISDDGKGFNLGQKNYGRRAGFKNMETRIRILNGTMNIKSVPGNGTILSFIIPFE